MELVGENRDPEAEEGRIGRGSSRGYSGRAMVMGEAEGKGSDGGERKRKAGLEGKE